MDAIVLLAAHPKDEVQVGRAGTITALFHQFAPFLTEKMMGKQTHLVETTSEPAPNTPGNLNAPQPGVGGTEVTGGWREK